MVPFWVLRIIRHLVFRGPKRDHNLDNHPGLCHCVNLLFRSWGPSDQTEFIELSWESEAVRKSSVALLPSRSVGRRPKLM